MTTTVDEVLDRLKALQEFDRRLRSLERDLTAAPQALGQHREAAAAVDAKIQEVDSRARVLRGQIKLRENELKSGEQKIERLKAQSSEVRTNREFVAFRSEIANFQGDVDRLQGEILKILDVVEHADARIEELEAEKQGHLERAARVQAKIDEELTKVREERDRLLAERPEHLEGIPEEPLAAYERAREARGTGMALLEGQHCGACGEFQTRNDVYAIQNRSRVVLCRGCNVILHQV